MVWPLSVVTVTRMSPVPAAPSGSVKRKLWVALVAPAARGLGPLTVPEVMVVTLPALTCCTRTESLKAPLTAASPWFLSFQVTVSEPPDCGVVGVTASEPGATIRSG